MNKYKAQASKARQAYRRARRCENKTRYATEAEAYQKGQDSYRCPYCNGWHRSGSLTSLAVKLNRVGTQLAGNENACIHLR